MKKLVLRPLIPDHEKSIFISEIQEAFQRAYIKEFGNFEKTILPVADIEESFNAEGAEIYIAEIDGERVGGAVIVVTKKPDTTLYIFSMLNPVPRMLGMALRYGNRLKICILKQKFGKRTHHIMTNEIFISI